MYKLLTTSERLGWSQSKFHRIKLLLSAFLAFTLICATLHTSTVLGDPPQRSVYDRTPSDRDAARTGELLPRSDAAFPGNATDVSPAAFQAPITLDTNRAEPRQDPFANRDAFPAKQASFTTDAVAAPPPTAIAPPSFSSPILAPSKIAEPTKSDHKTPLKLSAADKPKPITGDAAKTDAPKRNIDSVLTVLGSLGIVLGLFMVVAWCMKRGMPNRNRVLSSDVVEVLGRAPLVGKQQMHLLRLGHKLVLVAVSPSGIDTIAEVTDPHEVDRLAGLCMQSHPTSSTNSFRGIMAGYGRRGERATEVDDA